MTATQIINALAARYKAPEYAVLTEVRNSAGEYGTGRNGIWRRKDPQPCQRAVEESEKKAGLMPNPNPSPNPICPISPEAHVKSTLAQILRQHPTLPLAHVVRLLRKENERLMKRGHRHMTVDEMRFVISGVLGPKGRELFDAEVAQIEAGVAT